MAFAATVEWEVRTTGSDSNGGGFDPTSGTPGTDYSQQNSAQIAYTDLVIDGTTNTKCTSSANPFTSAHVGNIINITGGTGFTVQRVQVMSVTGSTATVDKSLGTLSSTGGTGNLGGGLLTLATAAGLVVTSNRVHVKAGTYTFTSRLDLPGITQEWWGYQTTHKDNGTKPLITTATNSTALFGFSTSSFITIRNLSFSNTAAVRANGLECRGNYGTLGLYDCLFDGFTTGIAENGGGLADLTVSGCEFKNCSTRCVTTTFRQCFQSCYFHDGVDGINQISANHCAVVQCIFDTLTGTAFNPNSHFTSSNCTYYNCNKGIDCSNQGVSAVENNIFEQCTTAISFGGGQQTVMRKNAFYNNTTKRSGTYRPAADWEDVTLTGSPFTDAANANFALNNTAGAGAACKNAGHQWGS